MEQLWKSDGQSDGQSYGNVMDKLWKSDGKVMET